MDHDAHGIGSADVAAPPPIFHPDDIITAPAARRDADDSSAKYARREQRNAFRSPQEEQLYRRLVHTAQELNLRGDPKRAKALAAQALRLHPNATVVALLQSISEAERDFVRADEYRLLGAFFSMDLVLWRELYDDYIKSGQLGRAGLCLKRIGALTLDWNEKQQCEVDRVDLHLQLGEVRLAERLLKRLWRASNYTDLRHLQQLAQIMFQFGRFQRLGWLVSDALKRQKELLRKKREAEAQERAAAEAAEAERVKSQLLADAGLTMEAAGAAGGGGAAVDDSERDAAAALLAAGFQLAGAKQQQQPESQPAPAAVKSGLKKEPAVVSNAAGAATAAAAATSDGGVVAAADEKRKVRFALPVADDDDDGRKNDSSSDGDGSDSGDSAEHDAANVAAALGLNKNAKRGGRRSRKAPATKQPLAATRKRPSGWAKQYKPKAEFSDQIYCTLVNIQAELLAEQGMFAEAVALIFDAMKDLDCAPDDVAALPYDLQLKLAICLALTGKAGRAGAILHAMLEDIVQNKAVAEQMLLVDVLHDGAETLLKIGKAALAARILMVLLQLLVGAQRKVDRYREHQQKQQQLQLLRRGSGAGLNDSDGDDDENGADFDGSEEDDHGGKFGGFASLDAMLQAPLLDFNSGNDDDAGGAASNRDDGGGGRSRSSSCDAAFASRSQSDNDVLDDDGLFLSAVGGGAGAGHRKEELDDIFLRGLEEQQQQRQQQEQHEQEQKKSKKKKQHHRNSNKSGGGGGDIFGDALADDGSVFVEEGDLTPEADEARSLATAAVLFNLGRCARARGDLPRAEGYFTAVLARSPSHCLSRIALAEVTVELAEFPQLARGRSNKSARTSAGGDADNSVAARLLHAVELVTPTAADDFMDRVRLHAARTQFCFRAGQYVDAVSSGLYVISRYLDFAAEGDTESVVTGAQSGAGTSRANTRVTAFVPTLSRSSSVLIPAHALTATGDGSGRSASAAMSAIAGAASSIASSFRVATYGRAALTLSQRGSAIGGSSTYVGSAVDGTSVLSHRSGAGHTAANKTAAAGGNNLNKTAAGDKNPDRELDAEELLRAQGIFVPTQRRRKRGEDPDELIANQPKKKNDNDGADADSNDRGSVGDLADLDEMEAFIAEQLQRDEQAPPDRRGGNNSEDGDDTDSGDKAASRESSVAVAASYELPSLDDVAAQITDNAFRDIFLKVTTGAAAKQQQQQEHAVEDNNAAAVVLAGGRTATAVKTKLDEWRALEHAVQSQRDAKHDEVKFLLGDPRLSSARGSSAALANEAVLTLLQICVESYSALGQHDDARDLIDVVLRGPAGINPATWNKRRGWEDEALSLSVKMVRLRAAVRGISSAMPSSSNGSGGGLLLNAADSNTTAAAAVVASHSRVALTPHLVTEVLREIALLRNTIVGGALPGKGSSSGSAELSVPLQPATASVAATSDAVKEEHEAADRGLDAGDDDETTAATAGPETAGDDSPNNNKAQKKHVDVFAVMRSDRRRHLVSSGERGRGGYREQLEQLGWLHLEVWAYIDHVAAVLMHGFIFRALRERRVILQAAAAAISERDAASAGGSAAAAAKMSSSSSYAQQRLLSNTNNDDNGRLRLFILGLQRYYTSLFNNSLVNLAPVVVGADDYEGLDQQPQTAPDLFAVSCDMQVELCRAANVIAASNFQRGSYDAASIWYHRALMHLLRWALQRAPFPASAAAASTQLPDLSPAVWDHVTAAMRTIGESRGGGHDAAPSPHAHFGLQDLKLLCLMLSLCYLLVTGNRNVPKEHVPLITAKAMTFLNRYAAIGAARDAGDEHRALTAIVTQAVSALPSAGAAHRFASGTDGNAAAVAAVLSLQSLCLRRLDRIETVYNVARAMQCCNMPHLCMPLYQSVCNEAAQIVDDITAAMPRGDGDDADGAPSETRRNLAQLRSVAAQLQQASAHNMAIAACAIGPARSCPGVIEALQQGQTLNL